MTIQELSDLQLAFLLAMLVDPKPQVRDGRVFVDAPTYEHEFSLEDPKIFKMILLDSRATLGVHLEEGDFYGNYRAIVHASLSLLEHDSFHGTVDAIADTPERALGRAVLLARYGYEELPTIIERTLPCLS